MAPSVRVAPLREHREFCPLVVQWFRGEWPEWYGPGGSGSAEADVNAFAASDINLPVGLLAFDREVPVGVGALKTESIPSHKHLTPWAAAGFVLPKRRGQGIGAALLQGLVTQGRKLGFPHVYCGTSTSKSLLVRSGWEQLEVIVHSGKPLAIFRSAA